MLRVLLGAAVMMVLAILLLKNMRDKAPVAPADVKAAGVDIKITNKAQAPQQMQQHLKSIEDQNRAMIERASKNAQ